MSNSDKQVLNIINVEPLFQKQKYRHRPEEGIFGDCHRTCIASLLGIDRDSVPHWGIHFDDPEKFFEEANAYLKSQNIRTISIPCIFDTVEDCLNWMGALNKDMYYLLVGRNKNNVNHIVICKDNKIVWDTSLDDSGIVGPTDEAGFLIEILVRDYSITGC